MPRLQIALETDVVLDYAHQQDFVVECFSTIRKKFPDSSVFIFPTVIDELNHHSKKAGQAGKLATIALQSLLSWGFKPLSAPPVGNGMVEETSRKIRLAGLLPDEEINDSYIVAEAAPAKIEIRISNDSHFKDIDHQALKQLLAGGDWADPTFHLGRSQNYLAEPNQRDLHSK